MKWLAISQAVEEAASQGIKMRCAMEFIQNVFRLRMNPSSKTPPSRANNNWRGKIVLYLVQLLDLRSHSVSELELSIIDRINDYLITINTLERTRLLARGHGGEIGQTILEAIRELNPYEELE